MQCAKTDSRAVVTALLSAQCLDALSQFCALFVELQMPGSH